MSLRDKNTQKDGLAAWLRTAWFLGFGILGCILLYQASPWSRDGNAEAKHVDANLAIAETSSGSIRQKIDTPRSFRQVLSGIGLVVT
jgi:hypothetical protein